jgi:excisionase family DNA binding protein
MGYFCSTCCFDTIKSQTIYPTAKTAADLLGISHTTLVRLLETGAIPFEKPSRHRKVHLRYRRRQHRAAELALAASFGRPGGVMLPGEESTIRSG